MAGMLSGGMLCALKGVAPVAATTTTLMWCVPPLACAITAIGLAGYAYHDSQVRNQLGEKEIKQNNLNNPQVAPSSRSSDSITEKKQEEDQKRSMQEPDTRPHTPDRMIDSLTNVSRSPAPPLHF